MEKDLELLKNKTEKINLLLAYQIYIRSLNNKYISYVPNLVDIYSLALKAQSEGVPTREINRMLKEMRIKPIPDDSNIKDINSLGTMELIKQLEVLYRTKITNNDIILFVMVLKTREDLFEALLQYSETVVDVKNDLYYWIPDLKICDVFSLLLSLFNINDLLKKFKEYKMECILLNRKYNERLARLTRERCSSTIFQNLDVINRDLVVFSKYKDHKKSRKIVSHDFWCDKCYDDKKATSMIETWYNLDDFSTNKDIVYKFRPCLSYVEVEIIGNVETVKILIPVKYLDDLYNGCKIYKGYWHQKGIIDAKGNVII